MKNTAILLGALCAGMVGASQAAEPAEDRPATNTAAACPALTVSAAALTAGGAGNASLANTFAARLAIGRHFKTTRAGECAWNDLPAKCALPTHVNLLELKFGQRVEQLAFMLDSKDLGITRAARATYRLAQKEQKRKDYARKFTPEEGYEMPDDAPINLVANFAAVFEEPPAIKGVCRLVVNGWEKDQPAPAAAAARSGSAMPGDATLAPIYPLAAAALYAAHYRAGAAPQEQLIVLSVAREVTTYALRATLYRGEVKAHELSRRGITPERLYESLQILFVNLMDWQGAVADWFHPGLETSFTPVMAATVEGQADGFSYQDSIVIGKRSDQFLAFNPMAGAQIWSASGLPVISGDQLFVCGGAKLAKLRPADGRPEFESAVEAVKSPAAFDARGDLVAVGVSFDGLALYRREKQLWKISLPAPLEAGPALVADDRILVGDAMGRVRELSLEGKERWSLVLPRPLSGALYGLAGLGFGSDAGGTLYALNGKGELVWRAELGEALLGPPLALNGALLAATKGRNLFLLDPATGRVLKQGARPSWLMDLRLAGDKIYCLEFPNRLAVLDAKTLAAVKELQFPFDLKRELAPVTDFSLARRQMSQGAERGIAGFLLADAQGYIYVCPASVPKE